METHRKRLLQTAQKASNKFHAFLTDPDIPKTNRLQVAEIYKGKMLPPRPRTAPPKKQVHNLSRVPNSSPFIGYPITVVSSHVRNRVSIQKQILNLEIKRIKIDEEINKLRAYLK